MLSRNPAVRRALAVFVLLFCQTVFIFAAPGDVDMSFGNNGQVILPLAVAPRSEYYFFPRKVLVQPDGKILTAGYGKAAFDSADQRNAVFFARHNADGTPDAAFGSNGFVFVDNAPINPIRIPLRDACLQPDGKILYLGEEFYDGSRFIGKFLARLNADGTRDTTFAVNGFLELQVLHVYRKVMTQPDGKILVAATGSSTNQGEFSVARLLPDGSADTTFGTAGEARIIFSNAEAAEQLIAATLQPDGKIIVGGEIDDSEPFTGGDGYAAVARINADGTLDTGFGDGGKITVPPLSESNGVGQITLQPNGKILVGMGHSYTVANLVYRVGTSITRYHADGGVDRKFRNRGRIFYSAAAETRELYSIQAQPDNKILLFSGYNPVATESPSQLLVERLNFKGFPDGSFGAAGRAVRSGNFQPTPTTAVQPDGRLLIAVTTVFDINQTVKIIRLLGD